MVLSNAFMHPQFGLDGLPWAKLCNDDVIQDWFGTKLQIGFLVPLRDPFEITTFHCKQHKLTQKMAKPTDCVDELLAFGNSSTLLIKCVPLARDVQNKHQRVGGVLPV